MFLETDNSEEFILANLSLTHLNETLEISFNEGENICFKASPFIDIFFKFRHNVTLGFWARCSSFEW